MAQIGAREHYVIARELYRCGALHHLLTDAWAPPRSWPHVLPGTSLQGLRERYHPDLAEAPVHGFTASLLGFELRARIRGWDGWKRMIRRNEWFERRLIRYVRSRDLLSESDGMKPIVFSYSYAAHDLFQMARAEGCTTVLGQIDAGPYEENLVADQYAQYPAYEEVQVRAPSSYWARWRDECALADHLIVNSEWSKQALAEAGIEGDHVHVVPLAYEPKRGDTRKPPRSYPSSFSAERPLRVLYLGTLTLRKGLAQLIEAAALLEDAPVEFRIVGGGTLRVPDAVRTRSNIRWEGAVPRSEVDAHYRAADVFLFPTVSDGFGLTQLEAQAQGLPVLASRRCGDVVRHGENGLRLEDVTPEAICEAVSWCLDRPTRLMEMARAAERTIARFEPARIVRQLREVVGDSVTEVIGEEG